LRTDLPSDFGQRAKTIRQNGDSLQDSTFMSREVRRVKRTVAQRIQFLTSIALPGRA
jgi:hypothetical protein